MKQLKFEHRFSEAIRAGKKTATFRMQDNKGLREGEELELVDKIDGNKPTTWRIPGKIKILQKNSRTIDELAESDFLKAEGFSSKKAMVEAFRRFYGDYVSEESPVMMLDFEYIPYASEKSYLPATNVENFNVQQVKLYADGGSRGNPGPSASGFVIISKSGEVLFSDNKYLGVTTNNQAEYHALLDGLKWCIEHQIFEVSVYLDSMLVVNQLKGIFKVKNRDLWSLYETAQELKTHFNHITFTHVPRELNKLADAEVNKALDAVKGTDIVQ